MHYLCNLCWFNRKYEMNCNAQNNKSRPIIQFLVLCGFPFESGVRSGFQTWSINWYQLRNCVQLYAIVTSALDPPFQNHIKTRTWNQPSKINVAPPGGSHVTHLLMSKRLLSSRPAMVGPDTKAGRSHWHTWEKWRQGANLESILLHVIISHCQWNYHHINIFPSHSKSV